ncbi:putative thiF family domain-containing protein [Neospora caninum Liverpool]|uniref:Putative thiF family domain-containing protein n=1 Tax=Neospora caninum (strain Liverpool) TaxID=572307 RepID=F0VHQ3_NEOCL|nr:putative thiF family domain-containing protein [Neospora caninum Liverpool]CBZ53264.1 putative thiF family domain-containing protein [Neospora caninum Liverpool]|eukprot:XP_003883296.1 putative thiF family domain-containing protein [Neospora caninum Liverpool]
METKAEAEEAVCGVPGRLGREAARAEEGESQREEGGSQRIEGGSQTEEKGRVDGATASGIGCRSSSLREEHRSAPNSSCSGPAASAASSHPRSEASSTRCICASRAVLRFHPFTLSIDVSFWRRLGETKLREWRLQTPWTPLLAVSTPKHFVSRVTPSRAPASFSPGGRTEWRREKAGSASPCSLSPAIFRLDQNAFDLASHPRFLSSSSDASPAAPCFTGEVPLLGFLYNCNSLEQFKAFNRQAAVSQILQAPILSASSLSSQEVRRGSASPDEAQNACGDSPGLLQLPVYEDAFWDFPSRTASLHQHNRPASTGSASLAPQSSPSSASSLSPASSAVASEAVSGRRDAPWLSQCLYTALPPIALACRFFLITFIDLKAFVAFYSVAVPAVRPGTDFAVLSPPRGALLQAHGASRGGKHEKRERTCGPQKGEEEKDDRAREAEGEEQREKREDAQKALSSHLSKYGSRSCPISAASTPAPPFLRSSGVCTLHLCYLDPSGDPQALGWPLRNLLLLLSVRFSLYNKVLSLLSFRDLLLHHGKVIQKDAVELNVQLIRWRLLPAFEPRRIQDLRVLLLGAGTLGCGVARLLVAWGVRDFTFVDSSCVALSNPARQCLYTYEDAMPQGTGDQSGGEPGSSGVKKVDAACRRLLAIRPDLRCRGFDLEIPMPGHPRFGHSTPPGGRSLEEAHDLLASLIDEHDVVMMLTDSKESRWLASLIVADRTLDQQCTVTRPGISSFACSVAVELLAALTQHPKGFAAPHIPSDPLASVHPSSESSRSSASGSSGAGVRRRDEARRGRSGERHVEDFSCMGATPHTVRGYFSSFRMLSLASERNPQCVCCSNAILEKYRENRVQFLREVIASSSVLEKYSGLEELQKQIEARGEDADVVCLSDEEEDENE